MLFFVNGEFINTKNEADIAFYSLNAELNLFLQENPLDIDAGIDYKSVLSREKFLKTEINRVCEKYQDRFNSFSISEPIETGEGISCKIEIFFKDSTVKSLEISI